MINRCIFLLALSLSFLACNRGVQTEAAVRQGVIDYLSSKSDLNISQMQVDVTSVSFRQNEADATVSFRPKGGAPGSGMQMRYTLERQGSRWVVKGRGQGQAGASPHGQMPHSGSEMPPGHPPAGGGSSSEAAKQPEAPKK